MKRGIYINRNHPILNYGQTGIFDSKKMHFYPDGGAFFKTDKKENLKYFLCERNDVWFDEDGYVNLYI